MCDQHIAVKSEPSNEACNQIADWQPLHARSQKHVEVSGEDWQYVRLSLLLPPMVPSTQEPTNTKRFDIVPDTDLCILSLPHPSCMHCSDARKEKVRYDTLDSTSAATTAAAFGRDHARLRFPASHRVSPHDRWWGRDQWSSRIRAWPPTVSKEAEKQSSPVSNPIDKVSKVTFSPGPFPTATARPL